MRSRIPTKFRLPGGFVVPIKQVPRPFALKGYTILEEDNYACWLGETRTVYLWEGLTDRQKWLSLSHELQHVINDYALWVRQGVGAE